MYERNFEDGQGWQKVQARQVARFIRAKYPNIAKSVQRELDEGAEMWLPSEIGIRATYRKAR